MGFRTNDKVELNLAGTWVDITSYVYERDPISISRGRSADASSASPSRLSLTLDNRDGRFSVRNPVSPYYGLLNRATPIRISLPYGSSYMRTYELQGLGSQASCPSASSLNVTDLDVRIDLDVRSWGSGNLCGKYVWPDVCSWFLDMDGSNKLHLVWTPDGLDSSRINAGSTVRVPIDRGRIAIRATLDVNNGSGGWTATFYTADSIEGPWTVLGEPVTGSGVTTIFGSSAAFEVGDIVTIAGTPPDAYYFAAELRNGINGPVVASADFSTMEPDTESFADPQGNLWTIGDAAYVSDRLYRFVGEVYQWPQSVDISGKDRVVTIQAGGLRRRLTLNAPPIRSPMFREFSNPSRENIVAYWPLEDGSESTQAASSTDDVRPAQIIGSPSMGNYSDWTASDPIPTLNTGGFIGTVPPHPDNGEISIRMFVFAPAGSVAQETSLLQLQTTGTVPTWDVRITTGGTLRTRAWLADGTSVLDNTSSFTMNGRGFTILDLELSQSGSNIDWRTMIIDISNLAKMNDVIPAIWQSGTVTGNRTLGISRTVKVGAERNVGGVVVGHLTVANLLDAYANSSGAIAAWNSEDPVSRMSRLCWEEGVPFYVSNGISATANAVTMGDQENGTLVDLLDEVEASDEGIFSEPSTPAAFSDR